MKFVPREYQKLIIERILETPRVACWCSMGCGKTVSTLTAIAALQAFGMGPALVLAPLRVAQSSWPDEVEKWDHLRGMRVRVLAGVTSKIVRQDILLEFLCKNRPDVLCVNYEKIPELVDYYGKDWPFAMIVADESTRLKGFRKGQGGKRARELGKVAFMSERFVELTGTPAPNGFLDLWGQLWFLDKGERLGKSFRAYCETFFRPIRVGAHAFAVKWVPIATAETAIMARVNDLALKLNAEDWFDLEKPIVSNVAVKLSPDVAKVYKDMERRMFVELGDSEVEAANAAAKTSKCLQIASGAVYQEDGTWLPIHQAKLDALDSIREEANGMPLLVTYQFRHEVEHILARFPDAKLLDKNPETIRKWNRGEIPMLLAHPASCGHGLSLQDGGNILVFFSTGWNLEEHEQIIERIGPTRQAQSGHKRPVFIYNIIAEGTIDETVQQRIETKREVLDLLLERRKHHDAED